MTESEEVDDCHDGDDALGEDAVLELILLVPGDPGVTSDRLQIQSKGLAHSQRRRRPGRKA